MLVRINMLSKQRFLKWEGKADDKGVKAGSKAYWWDVKTCSNASLLQRSTWKDNTDLSESHGHSRAVQITSLCNNVQTEHTQVVWRWFFSLFFQHWNPPTFLSLLHMWRMRLRVNDGKLSPMTSAWIDQRKHVPSIWPGHWMIWEREGNVYQNSTHPLLCLYLASP